MSDTSGTSTPTTDPTVFDTGTSGISGLFSQSGFPGSTDLSGTFGDPNAGFSPSDQFAQAFTNPASMFGGYGAGGTDQYGQTAQQIQSQDPGSQLQGVQQSGQQTTSQSGQVVPTDRSQVGQAANQPGSLLNAIRQMGQPGTNPWQIGGGVAVPALQYANADPRQQGIAQLTQQMRAAGYTPTAQPQAAAPAPQAAPQQSVFDTGTSVVPNVYTGGGVPGAVGAVPPFAGTTPVTSTATPETTTPDPADPNDPSNQPPQETRGAPRGAGRQASPGNVGQAMRQLPGVLGQFFQTHGMPGSLGQMLGQLIGGQLSGILQQQGLGGLLNANGMTGGGVANQVPRGYTAQNMPQWAQGYGPQTGRYSTGQQSDYRQQMLDVLRRRGQGGMTLTPTTTDPSIAQQPADQSQINAMDQQAQLRPADQRDVNEIDLNDAYNKWSRNPVGPPPGQRYPANTIQGRVANTLSQGGMSPNAVAGILQNIHDESSWNPSARASDQPGYGGEANYAHGLYQEGGPDWPAFQRFLNGRDWRDPVLQTQFVMQHFQQKNPAAFQAMNNARTPGQAAAIFVNSYLIPRIDLRQQRAARYLRGVAGVEQQLAAAQ
jgi:hypothetical protein